MIRTLPSQKVLNDRTLTVFALLLLRLLLVSMGIILRRSVENIEIPVSRITDFEYAGKIATTVAVVWSTPDRTESIIVEYLISFLTQLMRSEYV